MQNLNILASNIRLTAGTFETPEIEIEALDRQVMFDVLIESVNGTPSTATLSAKYQLAPINYNGNNMDYDPTSGVQRPWIDVVAADGYTGHLLVDGAWPADLAASYSTHRSVSRRLIVPPLNRLVRLSLTAAFTGGTTPNFRVTIAASTLGG